MTKHNPHNRADLLMPTKEHFQEILQDLTQVRIVIHSGHISQHPPHWHNISVTDPQLNGHDRAFACQYNNVAPTNFLTHKPQVPVNDPLRRSKRICGTIITIHNNTPEPSMFNTSTITIIIIHYNCTTQQSSPAPRNHHHRRWGGSYYYCWLENAQKPPQRKVLPSSSG